MSNTNRAEQTTKLLTLAGVTAAEVESYGGQDMNSNPKRHMMMCSLGEMLGVMDDRRVSQARWSQWSAQWQLAVYAATPAKNDR